MARQVDEHRRNECEPTDEQDLVGQRVELAIRPENVRVGSGGENSLEVKLRDRVFLGSKLLLHFHAAEGEQIVAEAPAGSLGGVAPGDRLTVSWPISATLVYSAP